MIEAAVTPGMKGDGFYDAHSEYQRRIVEDAAQAIRTMVRALPLAQDSGEICTVVDYGCGTGATTAQSMGTALRALRERAPKIALQASHADQVTNDFNQVFRTAAETYQRDVAAPLYVSAVAGSFFGQIVPAGSVAVGLCSNAAHWFRKQPKVALPGGIYFSVAEGEARAELAQTAADDWLAFLSARASELEHGGRLLVQGIGRIADVDGE
ncbi:MAG: class I SAM-dependent methyltransferase, partial [Verrucomicrobiota bacterium]|nr:class I SAM-dependent methyltransferase [Verrucomicrobiota bacterium]